MLVQAFSSFSKKRSETVKNSKLRYIKRQRQRTTKSMTHKKFGTTMPYPDDIVIIEIPLKPVILNTYRL